MSQKGNPPTRVPRYTAQQKGKNKQQVKPSETVEVTEVKTKKWVEWIWYAAIFLFTFLLYSNTFKHEWVLDDYGAYKLNRYVTHETETLSEAYENIMTKTYRHGSGFYTDNLYRPFSQLMFATEWELFYDEAKTKEDTNSQYISHIAHIINVIFYALSCVILFLLMRKLFKGHNRIIPLLITLLFAAHPMHTESIANTKSRDDIMCMLFMFSAMVAFVNYVDVNSLIKKILHLCMGFFFFLLAFFSKESAITMLAAVPLMIYFFRKPNTKQIICIFAAIVIPAAIYLLQRYQVLQNYPSSQEFTVSIMDHYYYDLWGNDRLSYWATAIMLLGNYLLLLIFPYQQVCDYSYSQFPTIHLFNWSNGAAPHLAFILSLIVHIGLVIYAILGIKKKDPIAYGILYYICTMSIFSNLVMRIGSSFADRFLYMPSLGYCIAFACLLCKLFKVPTNGKEKFSFKSNPVFAIVCIAFLGFFSFKTYARAAEWKCQFDLFGADVKKSDNSAHMRLYWGLALRDKGLDLKTANEQEKDWNKLQENNKKMEEWTWKAVEQFKKGVEIYNLSADCNEQLGIAYENLATLHPEKHYRDTAEKYFLRALEIVPSKSATNSNLAKIYFDRGDIQLAKRYYMAAILYDPIFADGYFNLGSCYGMLQMYDSSFYYYNECLKLQPQRAECFTYMGLSYANTGNFDKAVEMYERGIELNPYLASTYILAAKTYITMGKWNEALQITNKAIENTPFNGEAYFILGLLESHNGHVDSAIAAHKRCIELQPDYAEAYIELGKNYVENKHMRDSANIFFERAFQLKPQLFIR
ncbi:MAG: tetratricopeptide repeat protein [Bacteroidales bacterium]|nr:tetratricopeptide repeat protein [Bacteroidales bacterium]